MKKKLMALLLASTMVLSLFAGCGGGNDKETTKANDDKQTEAGDNTGEVIELTYWDLSSDQDNIQANVDAFNASQDRIHITTSFYDTDGIKDACKIAAQSGTLPSMWFNWGGSLGSYYPANGCTYNLNEYAEENGWADYFNSGVLSLCTLEDQICGYPTSYNVLGMYYRKDIFEANGLEVPTTMEEFEAVCDALVAAGITPISTGGLYGWHTMRMVEQIVEYYAGVELHDDMNAFVESWNNEAVVNALTKYQEWCDKGYFPVGFLTQDPNDTILALGSGTAAMDIQGPWYDSQINTNELNMDDYGWFAFPNGTGRLSAFAEMLQFNAKLTEEELAAAMEYCAFTYTEENAAAAKVSSPLPIIGAQMPGADQPNVSTALNYSAENGTFTITDQAFPTAVADVLFDAQAAICNGTMTPEEGAANIQAAIEEYVKGN